MTRSIVSSAQTKLASRSLFVADLIELQLSTTLYYTTTNANIQFDSESAPDSGTNTYTAQGQFLSYGNINETSDLRISSLDLTFTAVDTTTLAQLTNNDYIDKRIVIYRAILENDYSFTPSEVFMIFDGRISGYNVRETNDNATVTIQAASQFADFERLNGRRTNPASQNVHFPNDRGMDFSPEIVQDLKWGRN
jgi:hypothetical protein